MCMKTNNELPLCMMDHNLTLNDYDFVLFHLYKENELYREYYKAVRKTYPDRLMILDNSAYEFYIKGCSLDCDNFVDIINELKPDYYILPDYLMDMDKTLQASIDFLKNYGDKIKHSKPMGVLQGYGYIDFSTLLYTYKNNNIKAIAIPFHNDWYRDILIDDDLYWEFMEEFGGNNIDADYARGRVQTVRNISHWFGDFDHIHLLGTHQPFEKKYYKRFAIDTMDTGYPVKLALEGVKLGTEISKPNTIIDDFMNDDLDKDVRDLIKENIMEFKRL